MERNWKQCRDRIKNLLAKYRKTKDKNRQSGGGTVTCPFYDEIDAIVGSRPISTPQHVLESAAIEEEDMPTPLSGHTQEEEEQSESNSLADDLESEGQSPGMQNY